MRSFLHDYVSGAPDLLECFNAPPPALLASPPKGRAWNPRLVDAVRHYNADLGHAKSFDPNAPVIVTGQQPALFGGPLYTVYKAVTTLKLAALVEEQTGACCTPVFWVGSEDHDFEEARWAAILTRNHTRRTFRYDPRKDVEGRPMYEIPLDESVHGFIDEAAHEALGGEQAGDVAAFLHESLDAALSLSDWSARILARLFKDTRLTFFTPDLAEARRLAAVVIEREIREPLANTKLLNERALALERLDFPPQVVKGDSECNFFMEFDGLRRKVLYERGRFSIPEQETLYSEQEMLDHLHYEPTRFSPNVALRCIVQSHLFPAAAYVAGPGELAYWAQLKPVFERFELPMPVVYPRARAALTSIKLNKLLRKLGLTIPELDTPRDELEQRALRTTSSNPAVRFIEEKRPAFDALLNELESGLADHDKTAAGMVDGIKKEVNNQLARLERTVLNADATKNEATLKQLDRLITTFMPDRKPQERIYSVFSWLFEYGWDLIPQLMESIDIENFSLNEIEL